MTTPLTRAFALPAAVLLVAAGLVAAAPALAAPAPSTIAFGDPGTTSVWTVPAGVAALDITVGGAPGGASGSGVTGGAGGQLAGTFAVVPGERIALVVGAPGNAGAAGQAGGAPMGASGGPGGSGGWGGPGAVAGGAPGGDGSAGSWGHYGDDGRPGTTCPYFPPDPDCVDDPGMEGVPGGHGGAGGAGGGGGGGATLVFVERDGEWTPVAVAGGGSGGGSAGASPGSGIGSVTSATFDGSAVSLEQSAAGASAGGSGQHGGGGGGGGAVPAAAGEGGAGFAAPNLTITANGTTVAPEVVLSYRAAVPVIDGATLRADLVACTDGDVTMLAATIVIPTEVITVGCDATLDLAGQALTVRSLRVDRGQHLTITDSVGGGRLTAGSDTESDFAGIAIARAALTISGGTVVARSSAGAGIGEDANGCCEDFSETIGTLVVTGGDVTATSVNGAGIGSGFPRPMAGEVTVSAGLDVTISGGSVTAESVNGAAVGTASIPPGYVTWMSHAGTVAVNGGTLRAASANGAAIGRGYAPTRFGPGADVLVGVGATVHLSSLASPLGANDALAEFGSARIDGDLYVEGDILVPDSSSEPEIVIGPTGRLLGGSGSSDPTEGASISGEGQVANGGVVALTEVTTTVSGNDYLVTFDDQDPATTDPVIRLLAPDFASGYRTVPAPPVGTRWNTVADGAGAWFDAATVVTSDLWLYAVVPGAIDTSALPSEAPAGEIDLSGVTVNGPSGSPLSTVPVVAVSSSVSTDTVVGSTLTATSAGERELTFSTVVEGVELRATHTMAVVAGAVATLVLEPPTSGTSVAQGGSITFSVRAHDAHGNPIDPVGVILSSSVETDIVEGLTVTFPHASPHVITATLDGVRDSLTVEVVPASTLGATGLELGGTLAIAILLLLLGVAARRVRPTRSN